MTEKITDTKRASLRLTDRGRTVVAVAAGVTVALGFGVAMGVAALRPGSESAPVFSPTGCADAKVPDGGSYSDAVRAIADQTDIRVDSYKIDNQLRAEGMPHPNQSVHMLYAGRSAAITAVEFGLGSCEMIFPDTNGQPR